MSKPFPPKKQDKDPKKQDKEQKGYALDDDTKKTDDDKEVQDKDPRNQKQQQDGPPPKDNEDDKDADGDQDGDEEESSIKKKKPAKNSNKDGPSSDNSDNNDVGKGKTKVDLDPELEVDDEDQYMSESRAERVIRIAREYRDRSTLLSINEAKAAATYRYQGVEVPGVTTMKVEAPSYHKEKHEVYHNGNHVGHVYSHETSQYKTANSVRWKSGGKVRKRWGYEHKASGSHYSDLSSKKDAVEELIGSHIRHQARQS